MNADRDATTADVERSRSSASTVPSPLADALPTAVWLVLGVLLQVAGGMRWGIPLIAWFSLVPFMVVAERARTVASWLGLIAVLAVAGTLQVAKIVTDPIPLAFAPLFGVPIEVGAALGLFLWAQLHRRVGPVGGMYGFAALSGLFGWLSSTTSDLGVWGLVGNSLVDMPGLLQIASLVGLPGIEVLVGWAGALVAAGLLASRPRELLGHAAAFAMVLLLAQVYGTWRLHRAVGGPTVQVAAVVTDLGLGPSGLPSERELADNTDLLFARSALAADRGARLVVWNEAAAFVLDRDAEARLVERGRDFARDRGVDLVLAYALRLTEAPLTFDNAYVWIDEQGEVLERYLKHHPVPTEGSTRGEAPLRALQRPWGVAAGAICYDYDFPAVARGHARLGAGLVAVPSSDWRGIDPLHTKMARVRAIEAGLSVVRSVRWAASAAFDPMGRVRAWMSVDEANDRVMLAEVPTTRVPTIYAATGDAPVVVACSLTLLGLGFAAFRKRAG